MMGDISTEPSMEEILSSIKRIIAEEGDVATGSRARRAAAARPAAVPAPTPVPAPEDLDDEILELSEPAPEPSPHPQPLSIGAPDVPHRGPELVSDRVVEAARSPLEALSRMVVKPEVTGSDTLEGMVREMVRPMLREWLDANLPTIVETMVAREIERITGRQ